MQHDSAAHGELIRVRVSAVRHVALGIVEIELSPMDSHLPPFAPGAHVDLHLPNGMVRQYSLCGPADKGVYVLGVALAPNGRGGSAYIHDRLGEGAELLIGAPRNNFPLTTSASRYRFIAGGIGITPILSMVRWCSENSREWRLHYCAQSRERTAYLSELSAFKNGQVALHFDDEAGAYPDVPSLVADLAAEEHVYCCGPRGLMQAVQRACLSQPPDRVHFEWFAPSPGGQAGDREGFDVVLMQTGRMVHVPSDKTILEALEDEGIMVPSACRQGVCGSCLAEVRSGDIDHRDQVLSDAERASGRMMLICVSRAKGGRLVLNL